MSDRWQTQTDSINLTPGDTYRISFSVKAPYSDFTVAAIKAEWEYYSGVRNYDLISVDTSPPLAVAHTGDLAPWPVVVTFTVRNDPEILESGLDPRVIEALLSTIVVVTLAWLLVAGSPRIEHLVHTVGQEVRQTITEPLQHILNPGLVLLAFVAFALFLFTKSHSS